MPILGNDSQLPMLMNGQVKVGDIKDKVELQMAAELPYTSYLSSDFHLSISDDCV